jgi:hypothetical protein
LIQVDKCKNFDGFKCKECGRMMPASCLEQDLIEEKARKYDELVAEEKAEPVTKVSPKKTPAPKKTA